MVWKYPFAYLSPTSDDGNMAVDVPTMTSIRVQFDRFLEPQSAVRATICIESASPGTGGCVGGAMIKPEYDPVDRVAVWKNVQLEANLPYNVRIVAPKDANDPNGIRAFDGVPLEQDYVFSFHTAAAGSMPNATWSEPNRSGINFCSASAICTQGCYQTPSGQGRPIPDSRFAGPEPLFGETCAGSGCHSAPGKGRSNVSGSALTLEVPGDGGVHAAVTRLVSQSVVATETAVGPAPDKAKQSEKDIFGLNMPVIDRTNPGNSFLLYKVLLGMPPRCGHAGEESANPINPAIACTATGGYAPEGEGFRPNQYPCASIVCVGDAGPVLAPDAGAPGMAGQRVPPLVASWVPEARWKPPAAGEYNRLRLRIRGDSMVPPNGLMTYQVALGLSAWIAAGATTDCPP